MYEYYQGQMKRKLGFCLYYMPLWSIFYTFEVLFATQIWHFWHLCTTSNGLCCEFRFPPKATLFHVETFWNPSMSIFTARIRRMREGNSFSLFVCPHPGDTLARSGWGGGRGYSSQVRMGGRGYSSNTGSYPRVMWDTLARSGWGVPPVQR